MFTAKKTHYEKNFGKPKFRKYQSWNSPNYCDEIIEWEINSDSIYLTLNLAKWTYEKVEKNNTQYGKYTNGYRLRMNGNYAFESDKASNTISISINGNYYSDVLTCTTLYNTDTLYYGKKNGIIAFHNKRTNKWFYKI